MATSLEMPPKKAAKAKPESDGGTKHLRANQDIVEMVAWIVRVRGGTTAGYVDPILRATVVADFGEIEDVVKAIRKAEAKAQKKPGA